MKELTVTIFYGIFSILSTENNDYENVDYSRIFVFVVSS